ncbi:DUF4381 family protein [Desulfosarcina cetonica]|uniref:DUF4381 family protein n=1 Tax=Desulfosarcina cetonica TaxID=90730 RepID=UPI0006D0760F|nr:DUF4381 family protein [Desulfosarcina cetonica]
MRRGPIIGFGLVIAMLCLWLGLPVAIAQQAAPASPSVPPGQAAPATPAPMTDIHDIRPPIPVGFDAPWLILALVALAAILVAAGLFWWWKRHRRRRTIETIVPELPPEMIANQALDAIGDVRCIDGKLFYFRLSAILRQYVFGRFGVGAPEMTTEEFMPCIDRLAVDRELARQFKQLCRAMDPVKFGGVTTMERQMEGDLMFARTFVRQTTPPDPAAPAEEPAAPSPPPLPLLPQGKE